MAARIFIGAGIYACVSFAAAAAPRPAATTATSSAAATSSSAPAATTSAAASAAPASASADIPPPIISVDSGRSTCAAIAMDRAMGMSSWEAGKASKKEAETSALSWCNTGNQDPTSYDVLPGANCTIAQSWCDSDLCSATAMYIPPLRAVADTDASPGVLTKAVSSKPTSKTAAMTDALARCTAAVCDAGDVDCSTGKPLCFISNVVCGVDAFEFTPDRFNFFDKKPLPANAYQWYYAATNVTGTIANLHY